MNLRRSIRKHITRVSIFLLVGAIVNVAVAWGCAVLINPYNFKRSYKLVISHRIVKQAERPGISVVTWHSSAGIRFPGKAMRDAPILEELLPNWARDSEDELFMHNVALATGWPMRTFWSHHCQSGSLYQRQTIVHGGIRLASSWQDGYWSRPKVLPTRVILRGLVVNTIMYAFMFAIITRVPFSFLRWRRRKRGQCVRCGYDLRQSPNGCPECGWNRNDVSEPRP